MVLDGHDYFQEVYIRFGLFWRWPDGTAYGMTSRPVTRSTEVLWVEFSGEVL